MSAHKSVKDLPKGGEKFDASKIGGVKLISAVVGFGCLAVTLFILFTKREGGVVGTDLGNQMSYSYLFAWTFFLTIGIGGVFWTILHHATNSGWGTAVRRQMENIASILPWLFLLVIPLFFVNNVRFDLWEWDKEMHHAKETYLTKEKVQEHGDDMLAEYEEAIEGHIKEEARLNGIRSGLKTEGEKAALESQLEDLREEMFWVEGKFKAAEGNIHEIAAKDLMTKHHQGLLGHKYFFYFKDAKLRLALIIFFFIVMVWLLRSWSIKSDSANEEQAKVFFRKGRYWGSFFILPFAVGFTFIVIDFLMALNYEWFSTMWGVYLFAGAALNGMGTLVLIITFLRSRGYLKNVVTMEHYHLMGKLMFAFCVFWAYIAFSQYFLIWYANITEETQFFLLRNSGWWNTFSICLVVGHFFIPFILLLWRDIKKMPHLLCTIAVWNLVMHFADLYWIVIPERAPSLTSGTSVWLGNGSIVLDIIAFLGVGGTMLFVFLHALTKSSVYPCGDPRLEESINVVN